MWELGSKENPCTSERDVCECIRGRKNCVVYVSGVIGLSNVLWKEIVDKNIILKVVRI